MLKLLKPIYQLVLFCFLNNLKSRPEVHKVSLKKITAQFKCKKPNISKTKIKATVKYLSKNYAKTPFIR